MNKKEKRVVKSFLLFFIISLILTGCRPSPVLQQIIYNQNNEQIDENQQMLAHHESGTEDEQLKDELVADATINRDSETNAAVADSRASDDASKSKDIEYDAYGRSTAKATDSPAKTGTKEEKSTKSSKDKQTQESTKSDSSKAKESTSKETTQEETLEETLEELEEIEEVNEAAEGEESSEGEKNTDNEGEEELGELEEEITQEETEPSKKVVTDGDGQEQEIPEDVQLVTALGPAATIVEMLGGSHRLLGSSKDFTKNTLANQLFSDISEIKTWWDNESISSSNFEVLLKAKPEVCFEISGSNTFTSSQITKLNKAGIGYLVLPEFSTMENIKDAVTIIGDALGTNTDNGESSADIAASYCSWVDEVISEVQKKTSSVSLSSVYLAEWKKDIRYTFTTGQYNALPVDKKGSGSGVAIAWAKDKANILTTFMKAAGVENEAADVNKLAAVQGLYVTPMFHQLNPSFSSDEFTYYAQNIAGSADYFVTHRVSDSSYELLGSDYFPAIIVADEEVKKEIENNWYWQYHGEFKFDGTTWKSGYVNEEEGVMFYGSIGGDYKIYVNPSGITDWESGSIESPLEAYWVAYKFSEKYSKSELYSKIQTFYKTYLGTNLSNTQLKAILGE